MAATIPAVARPAPASAPVAWTARGMGVVGVLLIVGLVLVVGLLGLHRHAAAEQAAGPSLAPALVPTQPSEVTGQTGQPTPSAGPTATVSGHPLLNLLSDVVPKGPSTDNTPLPTTIEADDSVPTSIPGRTPEMLMADGDPRTAWQTQGDGSGRTITVEFPQERTVTQVGLINGFADGSKYAGERRILEVQWTFDGGRSVIQTLRDRDPDLQYENITPITTSNVTITLLRVSDSASIADDYTAISELRLSGRVS